jgi:hypothetical protein
MNILKSTGSSDQKHFSLDGGIVERWHGGGLFMLGFWVFMGYMVFIEGAPIPVIVMLIILYALGIGLLTFLINAYRTAPEYIERLERRIFGKEW